jgi:hypothetical protein
VPSVKQKDWPRNDLDRFILARLEEEGLRPSPEANKQTLIRRSSLDLTGLPPTPDLVPLSEDQIIERLLKSPHYGERMALDWLDAARYADTNGYQVDRDREMWPWRDWVIAAFNANMPFDQFTIEQLAGDLLPNPTLQQRLATGFNRNHMINEEGGIIAEEFLAEYTADRVETTAAVWLGQTFNCCRCHDHKYDPFTAKDFYSLKAFFHNVPEQGIGQRNAKPNASAPPILKLPMPALDEKKHAISNRIAALQKQSKAGAEAEIAKLKKDLAAIELEYPASMIMAEMEKPRDTFVLVRGAYDKKGEKVTAATPAVLPAMPDDLPRNRLGLAKWLVSPQNPLTARVIVNRFWQQIFGAGLVKTSEDFGAQGDSPSHLELLDWLAGEFIRSGWDVKHLMKLMLTSSTYRQQSHLTPQLRERDPENRLLARAPRVRLTGEFIRDQALAVSGLLAPKIGGPPVRPYHPAGLYETLAATSDDIVKTYVQDHGDSLYRRSLYTYWKRSIPHPALLSFGTPFREVCTLRRPSSNTPLQALNLMNDTTYVEAARHVAARAMQESGSTPSSRLSHLFQLVLARNPTPQEQAILQQSYERALADFKSDPKSAKALLQVGEKPSENNLASSELAALTTLASTLLCMDETITKP